MRDISCIAVYCGSNVGNSDIFKNAASALGFSLANSGIKLIFGGAHTGLMGVVADAVLSHGGQAHGIITEKLLAKGHLHQRIQSHEVVSDMAVRKARMAEMADGLIALPGGFGTIEELMDVVVRNQLGYIDKPVGVLNVAGFFESFFEFINTMVCAGFLPKDHVGSICKSQTADDLIEQFRHFQKSAEPKWINIKGT